MATIFTHGIVGLTSSRILVRQKMPKRYWYLASFAPMLPDLDGIGRGFGIPYASCWGHRGAMHSLLFAAALSVIVVFPMCLAKAFSSRITAGYAVLVLCLAIAEHGLVDGMTNGGLGVAFFWPFSCKRYFFGFRPIQVSPLSASTFLDKLWPIFVSEVRWLIAPCLILLLLDLALRYLHGRLDARRRRFYES